MLSADSRADSRVVSSSLVHDLRMGRRAKGPERPEAPEIRRPTSVLFFGRSWDSQLWEVCCERMGPLDKERDHSVGLANSFSYLSEGAPVQVFSEEECRAPQSLSKMMARRTVLLVYHWGPSNGSPELGLSCRPWSPCMKSAAHKSTDASKLQDLSSVCFPDIHMIE